jgi:hypothetical protein
LIQFCGLLNAIFGPANHPLTQNLLEEVG